MRETAATDQVMAGECRAASVSPTPLTQALFIFLMVKSLTVLSTY